jgi:hypothetical protein
MNWTDNGKIDALVGQLFDSLRAIAENRTRAGLASLDVNPPAPGVESFFSPPIRQALERGGFAQFNQDAFGASIVEALMSHWKHEGSDDLVNLGEALKALDLELVQDRAQDPEVSHLVYVMY